MTCIVGLVNKNDVYMGCDSASGSADWEVRASAVPKIFKSGPFLVGYTGSWRMGQILQHHLSIEEEKLPKIGDSIQRFMVRVFIEEVRKLLKEHGYAQEENNQETGGEFLVAFEGYLFHIEADYQVNENLDNYDACGAAAKYALGALWATKDDEPEARIRNALEAAAHFSGVVRPPYTIEMT